MASFSHAMTWEVAHVGAGEAPMMAWLVPAAPCNASDATLHSALMFAVLMIGHHFSISAFWSAASASGVCFSRGQIS
jgi:hypothetical protein